MMVLQVTNNSSGAITIASLQIPIGDSAVFPADRCHWITQPVADNSNYTVTAARFVDSNDEEQLHGTGRQVLLGQIGKSGRFVGFTV